MMKRRDFCRTAVASAIALNLPGRLAWGKDDTPADVPGVTLNGDATVVNAADLEQLRRSMRGGILLASDDGYDDVRRLWNRNFDKRPAVIARCTGAADVKTAVDFARHYNLLTAVRCGGHNAAGKGSCDGGIMIDLQPLQGVKVDAKRRIAYVAGGSLLGSMDHETMAQGLVTTTGTVSHTGVGGLSLGGGFGRVGRRFGLAADNIKALDVVTADGRFLHASPADHEDLYWGCRGGGGNFGVVTGFEFQLHSMQRQVVGGRLMYSFDKARELVELYGEHTAKAADELYVDMVLIAPPNGADRVVLFSVCYSGPPNHADKALKPFLDAKPKSNQLKTLDYVTLQRSGDNTDPRSYNSYTKGAFTTAVSSGLARTLVDNLESNPDRTGLAVFQHAGGAIRRVDPQAAAFVHRYAEYNFFVSASWSTDIETDEHLRWARSYWDSLSTYGRGFYVNDLLEETQEAINGSYLDNYERLVTVKKKYDPANLFRLNANIDPSV